VRKLIWPFSAVENLNSTSRIERASAPNRQAVACS
jgi:hypothetical protein